MWLLVCGVVASCVCVCVCVCCACVCVARKMKMYRLEQAHRCTKQANWPRDAATSVWSGLARSLALHRGRERDREGEVEEDVHTMSACMYLCRCCKRALPVLRSSIHCKKFAKATQMKLNRCRRYKWSCRYSRYKLNYSYIRYKHIY